jgi:hypothetical protein
VSEDRPLRVVIGEDDVLMREGIARLAAEAGGEVVPRPAPPHALSRRPRGVWPLNSAWPSFPDNPESPSTSDRRSG